MKWLFGSGDKKKEKAKSKPKELPQPIGRRLVVDEQKDPDWVWNLRMVTTPRNGDENAILFRVFDPQSADVKVTDFESLDEHAELVLYKGWYNKKSGEAVFE